MGTTKLYIETFQNVYAQWGIVTTNGGNGRIYNTVSFFCFQYLYTHTHLAV